MSSGRYIRVNQYGNRGIDFTYIQLGMGKAYIVLLLCFMVRLITSCQYTDDSSIAWEKYSRLEENQLTFGNQGHFLHTTQVFSPDDQWIAYDSRNKDSHIGRTCCIHMVNTSTKEIKKLYQTTGQTLFGPGVGGVTFSPVDQQVLFIHGLPNCNKNRPYGFSRRLGAIVRTDFPGEPIFMDARNLSPPYTPGALRGGSHAHTWSGDGKWISFTYNDEVMTRLEKLNFQGIRDLRMVGVMAPYGPVEVHPDTSGENLDGRMFSVAVSRVTENPEPGSDQIDRAYSDGWVGTNGYMKEDGSNQKRAVAFLGDTRDEKGDKLTEVFLVDIPDDVRKQVPGEPLAGTDYERPFPPEGTIQRRLTYTADRKYPGVQGPRHWIRSAPDGSMIYFMMKDNQGIVQIFGTPPTGGKIRQITMNEFPVETTFSVSPDGNFLAYGFDQQVYLTEVSSSKTKVLTPKPAKEVKGLKSISWSNDGRMLAYNRTVTHTDSSYIQIFLLK